MYTYTVLSSFYLILIQIVQKRISKINFSVRAPFSVAKYFKIFTVVFFLHSSLFEMKWNIIEDLNSLPVARLPGDAAWYPVYLAIFAQKDFLWACLFAQTIGGETLNLGRIFCHRFSRNRIQYSGYRRISCFTTTHAYISMDLCYNYSGYNELTIVFISRAFQ